MEPAGKLLACALLAAIVFGYLMPATDYFSAVPGSFGIPRHDSMLLEHQYRVATGYEAGLWNPDFFYPFEGALAFSETLLGSGPIYVLARLAGLPREHAYDAWFAVGVILNYVAALYTLRRLGLSTAAAALGACFFSFAVPVPAQDTHAQLTYRFAAPLAVLALWQGFERRRLLDFARAAFFAVWQFYCSIYLGVFLLYLLAALSAASLITRKPLDWPRWKFNLAGEHLSATLAAAGMLLASLAALAYLFGNYAAISHAYHLEHWRPIDLLSRMLPRLGSYLIADTSPLLEWLGRGVDVPDRWEHQLFIGFGAIALVVTALLGRSAAAASHPALTETMALALAALVLGTLWVGYLSFYYLIAWIPGIKEIRSVTRIIYIMLVPMSVLIALGAEAVLRSGGQTPRTGVPVLLALAALVVAEPLSVNKYNTPIAQWRERLRAVEARLPSDLPRDAILLVRTGSGQVEDQIHAELDGMLLGQDLGRAVLNGYSAFAPPGYSLRRCPSPRGRLEGYSQFSGGVDIAGYARRVVVVDLDSRCAGGSP